MLIELEKIENVPWSPFPVAKIKTTIGRTVAPWRGEPDARPGRYHIEWTIETETIWGLNTKPAEDTGPAILQDGHSVILRGILRLYPEDSSGILVLDGSIVLLDLDGLAPQEADGSWIQIQVDDKDLHLYPYKLY